MDPREPTRFPVPNRPQRSLDHLLPPTPREQIAIGNLQAARLFFNDQSIFDWLQIVRSAWNEIQQRASIRPLTDKEFIALAGLRSADDENIRAWLRKEQTVSSSEFAISHGFNGEVDIVEPPPVTDSTCSSVRGSQASSRKFARSSAWTTPRSSLHSSSSKHSSFSQADILAEKEKSESSSERLLPSQLRDSIAETDESAIAWPLSETTSKKYRCTTGEHLPKAWSSKPTAFRRHEYEHIIRYHCISRHTDLVYDTAIEKECLLCGELNPDQRHLAVHNIEPCFEKSEPMLFTRQDILTKHLKEKHAVPAPRTAPLAKKWCYHIEKTAFTCGICVDRLFKSKDEQICHVQREHSSEGMELWSETTMIRNLLRHPEVIPAWQKILAQNSIIEERTLSWPQSALQKVPLELDLNSETAGDFATAAFYCARPKSALGSHDTRYPLRPAAGPGIEVSNPSLEPSRFAMSQDCVGSAISECFGPPPFNSSNTANVSYDIDVPTSNTHTMLPGNAEALFSALDQSDFLQQPFIPLAGHGIPDEAIDVSQLLEQTMHSWDSLRPETRSETGISVADGHDIPYTRFGGNHLSNLLPPLPHRADQ